MTGDSGSTGGHRSRWTALGGASGARAGGLTVIAIVWVTGQALAAPVIERMAFSTPAEAHVGDPVLLLANGLAAPVRVFFSDGTTPSVEATPVIFDAGRGAIFTHVPPGSVTGNMKINAGGVDSPLFYFRVLPGTFTQGADLVSGQALNGATPVPGVALALIRDTGCAFLELHDFGVTDATGHYTLHGIDGNYVLYAFPPAGAGLAGVGPSLTLSSAGATLNLSLTAGTSVTGRVVDATTPSLGVGGARISFGNGPALEEAFADASGNFAARLLAGSWKLEIQPPAGGSYAFNKGPLTIGGASQNLGNVPLAPGIRVGGVLTRLVDGTPLAGAEIDAYGANLCCGKSDKKYTAGDGSYALFVPQNQTIEPVAAFDDRATVADVDGGNQAIGTSSVVLNLSARDAAFITGSATDFVTSSGVRGLEILTSSGGRATAVAFACADGTYRLRVVPDAAGYVVGTWLSDRGPAYALQTWNNTASGTYFPCEGVRVPAPASGGTTSAISFSVQQAVSLQGLVSSQAGACVDDLGNQGVVVDDSLAHACSMGAVDPTLLPPGYRIILLPPSSAVPALRACTYLGQFNPQCFNMQTPPAYSPIVLGAGATAAGINFCLPPCTSPLTWYRDADGDGHGTAASSTVACAPPPGYVATADDCDDANAQVWATPGEAQSLVFTNPQTINWSAPASLGGISVVYDVLRTASPSDFVAAATCVESNDGPNTTAADPSAPPVGGAFFYLARAENACPSGQGLLGTNSNGTPISGRNCP